MANLQLRVYVPPHPLIEHWLAIARDVDTPMPLFRTAIGELSHWLTYEATREWLPTQAIQVQTPLAPCDAKVIDASQPIAIVPILRAGLAMLDRCQAILSNARVYHLGFKRNEETLEASCYLNAFPPQFEANTRVVVTEPMLATGGTMVQTLQELDKRGVDISLVRVLSILAAAPALQRIGEQYPSLQIYTAMIDEHLDDRAYIVPGLGDAGDRAFGTED
ncbi:uracil phosphoribosyltransferase [Synechococcus sp. PCC 7336]|uniref:uracil phosphoribosyltransferase n=1 Tax=Synechococcus sp. PCC 7336 TaxID=195250 RepID=UPI00034AB306|nr:uracil phosphoribosyltransferase [Synechococcus sp. PCC 7336]